MYICIYVYIYIYIYIYIHTYILGLAALSLKKMTSPKKMFIGEYMAFILLYHECNVQFF